jgi:1,6-anhydro-N-acetylmuramate kinase
MDNRKADERLAAGVMTGTSIDGIDAALVRIDGRALDMRATLVRHVSESLGDLQPRLRAAAAQHPMSAGEFARLAWDFGALHAEVIERLLADSLSARERAGVRAGRSAVALPRGERRVDLICVHGQTVFHQPPISWQLVNPAPIAARFDCPVVSDLRQADLAHGGQGAPITPIADWILFRDRQGNNSRAIVNLGGFCNVTILPVAGGVAAIDGFDVCACNQLLDALARQALNAAFDKDGAAARRGRPQQKAVAALRVALDHQRAGARRRSLGTGDEALAWLREFGSSVAPDDLAASAVQAVAQTILATLGPHKIEQVILAGGGSRNTALRAALESAGRVIDTSTLGVGIDAREAACFAVLGALCQDGVPITLPAVTGCREPAPISGVWAHAHSRSSAAVG